MTCSDYEERISLYIDDELDDIRAVDLFNHLGTCSGCRGTMLSMLNLRSALVRQEGPFAPPELDARILNVPKGFPGRQLDRPPIASTVWRRKISMRIPVIVGTGSLLIFLGILFASIWDPFGKSTPQVQTVYITTLPTVEVQGSMP